jgi:hypothetical protein
MGYGALRGLVVTLMGLWCLDGLVVESSDG